MSDTPLADERERRRLEMLHLIDVGREQIKRNADAATSKNC
jgi:hypothetical protein